MAVPRRAVRAVILVEAVEIKFDSAALVYGRRGEESAPETQVVAFAVPFGLIVEQVALR